MPIVSKYSNQQLESLLQEILQVMERRHTPVDLNLMVLGNAVTHVLNQQVPPHRRKVLAESFSRALLNSLDHPAPEARQQP